MKLQHDNSALDGVVVLDASRVLAGPLAGQILGDHGAEVIKLESFSGDDTRQYGPPAVNNDAPYYIGLNRNKKNLALDLSKLSGREVFLEMLGQVDVLIENFKISTWKKWGFDNLSVLTKRYPKLIHCRISGFGEEGELGGLPGYDAVVQSVSGLMSINGTPEYGPVRMGIPIVDISTGMNAAMGVAFALHERERSGHGQALEVTLFDTALGMLYPHTANVLHGGVAQRTGNGHPNIVPYDLFPTKTNDLFIAIGNDRQFAALCRELGKPSLAQQFEYSTNRQRVTNRIQLTQELTEMLSDCDAKELAKRLMEIGVPCSPMLTVDEALALAHTKTREMRVEIGDYRAVGIPIKMARTPGKVRSTPSGIGQDSRNVLRRFGYSDAWVDAAIRESLIK